MKNKGFTLLVAIVTTSLLLIVSFVVVNVALKQLLLSYSNQESQYSYYNAESGVECAIYWDLKNSVPPNIGVTDSAFSTTTTNEIECYGKIVNVGGGGYANATSTFEIALAKGCVVVKVGKVPNPYGYTRIESYGYNNCTPDVERKFERGITITY